jgi:hypothetical protein
MDIGYKVVRQFNGRLLSYIPHSNQIEYKLGEWVEAKIGKLFYFPELIDALYFRMNSSDYDIYKCEIEGVINQHNMLAFTELSYVDSDDKLKDFWGTYNSGLVVSMRNNSKCCSRIKLLEKVYENF